MQKAFALSLVAALFAAAPSAKAEMIIATAGPVSLVISEPVPVGTGEGNLVQVTLSAVTSADIDANPRGCTYRVLREQSARTVRCTTSSLSSVFRLLSRPRLRQELPLRIAKWTATSSF